MIRHWEDYKTVNILQSQLHAQDPLNLQRRKDHTTPSNTKVLGMVKGHRLWKSRMEKEVLKKAKGKSDVGNLDKTE